MGWRDGVPVIQPKWAQGAPVKESAIAGGDLARSALQGATFNFGDELRGAGSAALSALMGQGSFSDWYAPTRDYERQKFAQFEEEHPVASGAAQVVGGLLTGGAGGARAAGTVGGRNLALKMAQMPLGARVGTSAGIGAGVGGAAGAVAGAGGAESMSDIPGALVKGGAVGLLTGGVTGGIGEGLMSAGRAAGEVIRRTRDPQHQAAKNINRAIERSGLTPDEALQRAELLGPDATLADVAPATREMLETVTNQPGAARGMAEKQLAERARKSQHVLLDDLGPGKKHETLDALKEYRQKQASPVYERAFDKGVPHTDKLEALFQDIEEYAPGIWKDAKRLGKLDLRNKGVDGIDLGDARPSLRGWQYVKEKLDDQIDSLYRSGNGKAATALADTRSRLLGELDSLNPDFAKARGMWADARQFEARMADADKFMTMTGADFEQLMRGLKPIDREAVKIGAIQAIEDRIERGQLTADAARLFRTKAMDRKMRVLFDNPKEYAAFKNRLQAATEKQRTFDAVRGNSATSRREAARQESNDWIRKALEAGVDVARDAASGNATGLLGKAVNAAARFDPRASEAARTATARLLLETDPGLRQAQARLSQGLLNAPMPRPQSPLLPLELGGLFGASAGLLAQ